MTARRADKAPWWIRLQPALVLAPVPDPVFRTEHPSPSFAVEDGEIPHRDAKRARLQIPNAPLLDKEFVPSLRFIEWVDSH